VRICYICCRFTGPYGGDRHAVLCASELGKLGHEVVIYTHRFSPDCRHLVSSENVKIIETGFPRVKSHDFAVFLDYLLAPNLIAKINENFDLIHVWNSTGAFAGWILKKTRRKYKAVHILCYILEPPRFAYDLRSETLSRRGNFGRLVLRMAIPIFRHLDKAAITSMDEIIVNGDWTLEQCREIYGRHCKLVYPGVEVDRFGRYSKQEARRILHLVEDLRIFLSVSKLHVRKRIDEALKVYKKYSENMEKAAFFIIGDGPHEDNLKRLAENLETRNVRFLGRLSDEEVTLYYKAADYFVFTAKNEPFGIAPLEAKVAGCKLIPEDRPNPILSWEESAKQVVKIYEELLG